jgi:hypothetical protein
MISLVIRPRQTMTWEAFVAEAPRGSIALDGMVSGGPRWDEKTLHCNLDHHDGCVREATMSTCRQAMFAVKGGLMKRLGGAAELWVNDPDQDTSLATWILRHHARFEGVQSHPTINRLLELTDRWDITGGAYPTALDDRTLTTHAWVFDPYTELRVSGALASANESVMRASLEAVHARLDAVFMGQGETKPLRTDAVVLHESRHGYKIVNETGGNEARYLLFAQGMDAFVSRVATRPDGHHVYSIGRRSRYIDFPVPALYGALNGAEPDRRQHLAGHGWGGSDIIGGSPRLAGSELSWEKIRDIIDGFLAARRGAP